MKSRWRVWLQAALFVLIGLGGLIPFVEYKPPFWGLEISGDKPYVHNVSPGSPAESAGFRNGDAVLAVNGSPLDRPLYKKQPGTFLDPPVDTSELIRFTEGLAVGESATIRVRGLRDPGEFAPGVKVRAEEVLAGPEREVTVIAGEPTVAAIYYPVWWCPLLAVGSFFVGVVTVVRAVRLGTTLPIWILWGSGVALAVGFFWAQMALTEPSHYSYIRSYLPIEHPRGAKRGFNPMWLGVISTLLFMTSLLETQQKGKRMDTNKAAEPGAADVTMNVKPRHR